MKEMRKKKMEKSLKDFTVQVVEECVKANEKFNRKSD